MTAVESGRLAGKSPVGARHVLALVVAPTTIIVFSLFFDINWTASWTMSVLPVCVLLLWPRPINVFEPIVLTSLGFSIMFGLRPLALLAAGQVGAFQSRFNLLESFAPTVFVGLVGYVAAVGGMTLANQRTRLSPRRSVSRQDGNFLDLGTMETAAAVLLALSLVGFAYAGAARGLSGFNAAITQADFNSDAGGSAYIYFLPFLAIPSLLLNVHVLRHRQSIAACVLAVTSGGILIVSLLPSGHRLWLLVAIGTFASYHYLSQGRSPKWRLVIPATVVSLIVLPPLAFLEAGERNDPLSVLAESMQDPTGSLRTGLLGPSVEMFDSLAVQLQIQPDLVAYEPGSSLLSLMAQPIPRAVWPSKPFWAEDKLNSYLFPGARGDGKAGLAFSVVGGFYYDSGLAGVVLGLGLFGLLWQFFWVRLKLSDFSQSMVLIYAAAYPLLGVMLRGNIQSGVARALFVVAPVVFVTWLARRTMLTEPPKYDKGSTNA